MPKAKKASDYQEKRKRYKANNNAVRKTPREEALEALEQMKLLQSARSPQLYKFVVYTPSPVVIETTSPEKYSRYIKDMQRRQAQSKLAPCKIEPQDV
nr:MAG TPA: hypothetical protein [Caudoviricetes sp.]